MKELIELKQKMMGYLDEHVFKPDYLIHLGNLREQVKKEECNPSELADLIRCKLEDLQKRRKSPPPAPLISALQKFVDIYTQYFLVTAYSKALDRTNQEKNELEKSSHELQQQYTHAQERIAELNRLSESRLTQIELLQQQLATQRQQLDFAQQQSAVKEAQLIAANQSREKTKRKVEELNTENKALKKRLGEADVRAATAEAKVDILNQTAQHFDTLNTTFTHRMARMEAVLQQSTINGSRFTGSSAATDEAMLLFTDTSTNNGSSPALPEDYQKLSGCFSVYRYYCITRLAGYTLQPCKQQPFTLFSSADDAPIAKELLKMLMLADIPLSAAKNTSKTTAELLDAFVREKGLLQTSSSPISSLIGEIKNEAQRYNDDAPQLSGEAYTNFLKRIGRIFQSGIGVSKDQRIVDEIKQLLKPTTTQTQRDRFQAAS